MLLAFRSLIETIGNPNPMRIAIAIAKGDPAAPAGWVVGSDVFMIVFPFDSRWRLSVLFSILSMLSWEDGDILICKVDVSVNAATIARLRELRERFLHWQKICLLDNGLQLSDLTPAQIAARVG